MLNVSISFAGHSISDIAMNISKRIKCRKNRPFIGMNNQPALLAPANFIAGRPQAALPFFYSLAILAVACCYSRLFFSI